MVMPWVALRFAKTILRLYSRDYDVSVVQGLNVVWKLDLLPTSILPYIITHDNDVDARSEGKAQPSTTNRSTSTLVLVVVFHYLVVVGAAAAAARPRVKCPT